MSSRKDVETAPRFAGIGGHHSHKAGTVEWLTPLWIIKKLGLFGLDPCAPEQDWPTAARKFTRRDNGLIQDWGDESVWGNPPYDAGSIGIWLQRFADHGNGQVLIFARTETEAFSRQVWDRAHALLFMEGRINFHVGEPYTDAKSGKHFAFGDRAPGNAGGPTVLVAYGQEQMDRLAACGIPGGFVPRRISRSVLVSLLEQAQAPADASPTWGALLAEFFAGREGPVELDELYRFFRATDKAKGNPNFDAKIRQKLQQGPYRRVQPGLWERA